MPSKPKPRRPAARRAAHAPAKTKPPSRTMSFYLSAEVDDIIRRRTAPRVAASAVVAHILCRYAELVRRELPQLEPNEWNFLRDILNGTWVPSPLRPGMLALAATDAIRLDATDQKWSIDGQRLIEKLNHCTYAQALAIVDAVEVWWALPADQRTLAAPDPSSAPAEGPNA